jgi:tRNA modification GTPase
VEAALDFPDEEVDFLAEPSVAGTLRDLRRDLDRTLESARQGAVLREGMHLVIAGRPNVGKSSLLNALAGRSTAIVTDIPGTTRDLLREHIQLDGLPLHLVDTAGLRDSADPVEQIGIARARDALAAADLVLLVTDDSEAGHPEDAAALASLPAGLPRLLVANKIDRSGRAPGLDPRADPPLAAVSARSGAGLDALRAHLKATMGYRPGEGRFIARRRHLDALGRAALHLEAAATRLAGAESPELVAEELHLAHDALGEITGRVHADELLGAIFSTFCIGK